MRKLLLLLAIVAGSLSSCMKQDDIRILEVEEWRLESLSTPVVTLTVENRSGKNVEIQSGKFTVSTSAGKIGELMLTDVINIRKKSVSSITLPLRMRISNPLAAAPLLSGGRIDTDRILISGQARVKAGAAKRNFTVEEAPFSRLISIFETGK